jgi:phosphoribosylamine--glycine ligase
MKILIVGQGAREHAIAHWIHRPSHTIYIAPGNPGTFAIASPLPHSPDSIEQITAWAKTHRPDLVVIGPELPLSLGLADRLRSLSIPTVGPNQAAARLESSKIFCKEILLQASIPTAKAYPCDSMPSALHVIQKLSTPYVIKADGLASGKGVFIPSSENETATILDALFNQKKLGAAAQNILIEERLQGQEISIMALTDGTTLRYLPCAQDHKRLHDHDLGPNTGGMGAYAPAPWIDSSLLEAIHQNIFLPLLHTLDRLQLPYQGILYAGIMITDQGPKVLEFNVRLGDPETQVILPLIATPLDELFQATAESCLHKINLHIHAQRAAVTIVAAAHGYPDHPRLGDPITLPSALPPSTAIFHAGTAWDSRDSTLRTAGGRILNATAWAPTLKEARENAYALIHSIHIPQAHYRNDIAQAYA